MEPEQSLEERLASIEADLRTLVVRVTELELREPSAERAPASPAPSPPLRTAAPPASPQVAEPAPASAAPPPKAPRPELELEDLLGGRILAWVGGLAIFVGIVFFLVIAVDRGWIGVEARVALAFLGSTVLLAGGYEPPFRLFYGAASVPAPAYDFQTLPAAATGFERAREGTLGLERTNDLFDPPGDTRSFFERNDSLIEVALVLAAIVVAAGGLLALRRRTAGEET